MPARPNYHLAASQKRNEQLRLLLKELPPTCSDYFRSIAPTTSALTRLAYGYDLRLFCQFLCREVPYFSDKEPAYFTPQDLSAITQRDLEAYTDYLAQYCKPTPAQGAESPILVQNHALGLMRKLSSLRSYFDYLFIHKHIPANITTLIPLPKLHDKPILRLEADEVQKILETAATGEGLTANQKHYQARTACRDTAILMLFLGTGIRVSECVGIDLEDLDFTQNAFLVTRKGGDQVILYFPQEVADALQAYIAQREQIDALPGHEHALFLSLQRRRITQRAVQNLVKKYAAVAAPLKKRISPHKLRSTFGTNLYHETGDIYLVADVLGHSDVNTTRRHYAAMTDTRRREAAKHVSLPPIADSPAPSQENKAENRPES